MKDLAKNIYKKYKEGGKVEKYQSDLLKEVEGMGPEGKRYLKDKLEGKDYKGELEDEYKHDLDKELEGMSEEGRLELKKLLGIDEDPKKEVDEDPWKDVKEELNDKKKDKKSIGELMAHSEEGYAEGGDVSTKRYISKLTPKQRREAALEEKFAMKKPKGAKFAWRPDQKKIDAIDKKYGVDLLDIERDDKLLDKQAKSSKMKKIIEKERSRFAKGGEAKKDWIQGAVKKPGALRAIAEKEKLIKGDEKLSGKDLSKLSSQAKKKKNKLLAKRVALAKTFAKMRK